MNRPDKRDLPLTANHWGTYRIEAEDGRVKSLYPFEQDGDPSPIGQGIVDTLDGPSRILSPAVRKSWLESGPGSANEKRGQDPFVNVSWDTAEQLVADELERVRSHYGNNAIYAGSYGWSSAGRFHHAQSQIHRFLKCIGGYTRSVNTYSVAAAEVIVPHILGSFWGNLANATSWPSIIENTELMVAFGGVPLRNGQITQGGVGRHVQRENLEAAIAAGMQCINISPIRADVDASANAEWIAPRPGTDTAILLAIAHTLYAENLYDKSFIDNYTHGFERFLPYLTGERDGVIRDSHWAAGISGLEPAQIRNLARKMANHRTMLSVSWSLTRQDHAEQVYWAAITVAAMLGEIGLPGGGIGFGYSAVNSVGDHCTTLRCGALPQGNNEVEDFIPVARIADMLLHPGTEFDYDGKRHVYPDTHIVYWAGGNPFHHHQDLNNLIQAWRKPDTVITHDWCWNTLARQSDIVLPCTTTLERNDIAMSPRDAYLVFMEKVCDPPGLARDDYAIFSGIARKMGVYDKFTEGRDEKDWLESIYQATIEFGAERGITLPDFDKFRESRWHRIDPPSAPRIMLEPFRKDPVKKPLSTATGLIEIFSPTVNGFGYDDCPGHPVWLAPAEWLGDEFRPFPLHLISNQPAGKLHSQLDQGTVSQKYKIDGREPITLHPADASARSINDGDIVRVFNARGACLAVAATSEDIRCGVVQMSTGAWYDPLEPGIPGTLCKHGNVNVLTMDKGTSRLAQGPIAHTCLVELEKYEGDPPPVTAFDPPVIIAISEPEAADT